MPGFVALTNRATGQDEQVPAEQVNAALASGKYVDPGAVAVHRDGLDTYTSPVVAARDQAVTPTIDPALAALAQGHKIRQDANTGALATAKAVAGGAVDSLSFGLVDPFQDEREFNPIASGIGQLGGAIAPAFVGDVGGLVGLGRDVGLADDALTAERAASGLSSKLLYGGEATGEAGSAERALARANGALTEAQAAPPVALDTLDKAGLEAERAKEIEAIKTAQQPEREALVRQFADHVAATEGDSLWGYTSKHPEKYVRGLGKESLEADTRVRNLLKNEEGLARNPERALDALERQGQALRKIDDAGREELTQFLDDFKHGPTRIRDEILAGKNKDFPAYTATPGRGAGHGLTDEGLDFAVERTMMKRYGTTDVTAYPKLPARLEAIEGGTANAAGTRVGDLHRKIKALTAEPTSERLTQIDSAIAELGAPKKASLGESIFHGVTSLAGPVGAVAEKAYAGLRKLVGSASKGASKAASSFLDTAAKAAPHVPVISTRVLAATAFAPTAAAASAVASSGVEPKGKADLATLYKQRTAEIRSQMMLDPATGAAVMRPDARAAMSDRLAAIRLKSPMLADRIETVAAARLAHLADVMPKQPDYGTVQIGPDRYQPSDLKMRSFARSVAAVEDPQGVLDRAIHGRVVPEDAAAMRAVHPEILADWVNSIVPMLPTLQRTLPYKRRLALSMLTGVPVDPAMTPAVLRVIQGMYSTEPGTAGGTQAPKPQPQFGSVKADKGTASQQRQQST